MLTSPRVSTTSAVIIFALTTGASADFNRWSVESEDDPFSGGSRISVDYSSSIRSGAFLFCDTAKSGVRVRIIPGFAYNDYLSQVSPDVEFAIDGKRLFTVKGSTGSVGDNLAATDAELSAEQSKTLAEAFARAMKQIAVNDGISDRPQLFSAAGSTKSGNALLDCLAKQQNDATTPATATETIQNAVPSTPTTSPQSSLDQAISAIEARKDELSAEQRNRLASIVGTPKPAANGQNSCEVTRKEYEAVQDGMTLEEVTKVAGCEGEETSSSESGGIRSSTRKWSGSTSAAAMLVNFSNAKVTLKTQFGLN